MTSFSTADMKQLETIFETITLHPGTGLKKLARILEMPYSSLNTYLITLEQYGFLLYEDDRGRLYPFARIN